MARRPGVGGDGAGGFERATAHPSPAWEAMRLVPLVHAGRGGGRRRGVGRLERQRHLFEVFGAPKSSKKLESFTSWVRRSKRRRAVLNRALGESGATRSSQQDVSYTVFYF